MQHPEKIGETAEYSPGFMRVDFGSKVEFRQPKWAHLSRKKWAHVETIG